MLVGGRLKRSLRLAANSAPNTMNPRVCWLTLALWLYTAATAGVAAEPPPGEISVIHDIVYREGSSRRWKLDLARKPTPKGKPRPAIAVIHGGGWIEGDKSSFASREHGVPGNIVDFAALGFVAVSINYRLADEAKFPAALEDCKCAVRWLRAHARDYDLDPERIGAFGNSAGGHLAMLLGMLGKEAGPEGDGPYQEFSSRVQAVVSDSGPIDLAEEYKGGVLREVCARFIGGPPEGKLEAVYRMASPAHHITATVPPLLLMYGTDDAQVPVETADRFVLALAKAGRTDVSYFRLAKVDHCPYSLIRVPFLRQVVDDFFVRTLMDQKPGEEPKRVKAGPARPAQ